MKIVLIGAPGAGKGTQSKNIEKKYGIPQISTGDILRKAVRDGTKIGKMAKSFMDKGELVPDDVIVEIMKARMNEPDCSKGFILDGFPRTLYQAEELEKITQIDKVINIELPIESLLKRLTARRSCAKCGAVYNLDFKPPPKKGKCECGGDLYQRDDDKEETIRSRWDAYTTITRHLIEWYSDRDLIIHIDGDKNSSEVFREIEQVLDTL